MTKRYIRILIGLIIAAIVAIGSYFGVTAYKNKQQKELAKEANKLNINSFAVQNITKIKITNSTGDYEFELDDDEWEQLSGEPVQVNTVKLNAISNNICELKAESILKENATAEDYPTYGLDKPMIVTAVLKDGKEKGVEVEFETVLKEMKARDKNDSEREFAPLRQADDAILLDTSELTLEESIAAMQRLVEENIG